MIQSLFILSPTGEILIERHFRAPTSRTICDHYWEKASASRLSQATTLSSAAAAAADTVPPILSFPSHTINALDTSNSTNSFHLISILRDGLSYLAVCANEVPPLLVLEFLHRMADTFQDYFGHPADESAIKDNFSTVYQLLEEMADYGWPLTTEPNALKALIQPPSLVNKLSSMVSGGTNAVLSDVLPNGTVSNMPWRKAGVKYSQNEIYVDIVEEIDCVVGPTGRVLSSDVSGSIVAQSRLSGVPDLLLTFSDPEVIDDCSFHPCVRYGRFEADKVISFVPPDGDFELMRYRVKNAPTLLTTPIVCVPQFGFVEGDTGNTRDTGTGRVNVTLAVKPVGSDLIFSNRKGPLLVEDVAVWITFPKLVRTANLTATIGHVIYDEANKVCKWTVGKMDDRKKPILSGSVLWNASEGQPRPEEYPPLKLEWKIPLASVSGLTVSGLSVTGEGYKPYKGVRTITKSGLFQVRTS